MHTSCKFLFHEISTCKTSRHCSQHVLLFQLEQCQDMNRKFIERAFSGVERQRRRETVKVGPCMHMPRHFDAIFMKEKFHCHRFLKPK